IAEEDGREPATGQWRIPSRRGVNRGDSGRCVVLTRDALADQNVAARGEPARRRAAPRDAEGEEVGAVQLVQARLDFHLRQRDVELLSDELLDPLDVRLVVADEDRVRRLVGLDRDALAQYLRRGRGCRRPWRLRR